MGFGAVLFGAALIAFTPAVSTSAADASASRSTYAPVVPDHPLQFPQDRGSHPEFRTEWWYVTGWADTDSGQPLGFQITFFRTRPAIGERNPSAFAPRQILIAHCALSDPAAGRLLRDQRIRRAGMGLAEASEGETRVWIDDWSLEYRAATATAPRAAYQARISADGFGLSLQLEEREPMMVNGDSGFSRKGPGIASASYYYSVPHLGVSGVITQGTERKRVNGAAWLDHEWSSEYLDARAAGWDWVGINLDDGGALMAFRVRGVDGTARWAGATLRGGNGSAQTLGPSDIAFVPGRAWTSPHSGRRYPVEWRVRAGPRELELRPLMDDQENDTRLSTGAIYWEGAVRAYESGRAVGRGYLELTGYGERLTLR